MNEEKLRVLEAARRRTPPGLVAEFLLFLKENKKFWLIPLLTALLLLGVIVALGGTAAAPFIYSLF
jgi:hypothetical protein